MKARLVFALAALLALCAPARAQETTVLRGAEVRNREAYDFSLIDQAGRPFRLSSQRGREVVLVFGYTHCPDVCPATLARLASLLHRLPSSQQDRVRVAFVTVDPARDGPGVLQRFVRLFDPRFIGLTGSEAQLEPVYDAYLVSHERVPDNAGANDYEVAHSTLLYFIDPGGRLRVLHDWQDTDPDISHDIAALLS
jgi:protein SCO1/2